jgi:predicted amidohydrolase YtcJ
MLGAEELAEVVTALDGQGFDVHVHAIGDRAVRDTLDAFEAAAPPTAAATPATRSPTSSSSTPTTAPGSAASG